MCFWMHWANSACALGKQCLCDDGMLITPKEDECECITPMLLLGGQ